MAARGLAVRGVAAALTAMLAVGAVGCSSSDGDAPTGGASEGPPPTELATVAVTGFRFEPEVLEVKVGEQVLWANEDDVTHTATAADGSFDLELDGAGTEASHTFTEPGTFDYTCSVHESMTGQIVVD